MNKTAKFFKLYLISLIFCTSFNLLQATINNMDEELVGSVIENLLSEMTEKEQQEFAKEIEYQQQKIMQMSPEERAAYEEKAMKDFYEMVENSPELLQKRNPEISQPNPSPKQVQPIVNNNQPKTPVKESKSKPVIISAEQKNSARQLTNNLTKAIDQILLKTNTLQPINKPTWRAVDLAKLRADLQTLKSYLPIIVSNDSILAELFKPEQKALYQDLQNFEKMLTKESQQLKTPDSLGLNPNKDAKKYDLAVEKLKSAIDLINKNLKQTNLNDKLNSFIAKHAPQKLNALNKGNQTKSNTAKSTAPAKQATDIKQLINRASDLLQKIDHTTDQQILDVLTDYETTQNTTARRKLIWQLEELEINLIQLIDLIKSNQNNPNIKQFRTEIKSVHKKYNNLTKLIKQLNASDLVKSSLANNQQKLNDLYTELNSFLN